MTQPLILDLFCNAGGAALGYSQAGFRVVGVDLHRQRNYPFPMRQGDAINLLARLVAGENVNFTHPDGSVEWLGLSDFAGVHASPPCQGLTQMNNDKSRHTNLIPDTVALLEVCGIPWILENVEGAEPFMPGATTLCGTMFGLGTSQPRAWLKRHRLFIASFPIFAPEACNHLEGVPCVGVYGGHARIRSAKHGGRGTKDAWPNGHRAAMSEAMGMTHATCGEMSEAIPPAYTAWLGSLLMKEIAA